MVPFKKWHEIGNKPFVHDAPEPSLLSSKYIQSSGTRVCFAIESSKNIFIVEFFRLARGVRESLLLLPLLGIFPTFLLPYKNYSHYSTRTGNEDFITDFLHTFYGLSTQDSPSYYL